MTNEAHISTSAIEEALATARKGVRGRKPLSAEERQKRLDAAAAVKATKLEARAAKTAERAAAKEQLKAERGPRKSSFVGLPEGSLVTINAEGKFQGQVGSVVSSRRVRTFVKVNGSDKVLYLLTSEVAPLSTEMVETVEETETTPEVFGFGADDVAV